MAAGDPIVKQAGGETGGFRIAAAGAPNTVRVECWGYFSAEVAAEFGRSVAAACRKAGERFELVIDARNLKPQSPDGQEAIRQLLRTVGEVGPASAVASSNNALTRMQWIRLARECEVDGVVRFDELRPSTPPPRS